MITTRNLRELQQTLVRVAAILRKVEQAPSLTAQREHVEAAKKEISMARRVLDEMVLNHHD